MESLPTSAQVAPYQEQAGEDYMSAAQVTHFRTILNGWKRELMEEVDNTVSHMKDDAANFLILMIVRLKKKNSP